MYFGRFMTDFWWTYPLQCYWDSPFLSGWIEQTFLDAPLSFFPLRKHFAGFELYTRRGFSCSSNINILQLGILQFFMTATRNRSPWGTSTSSHMHFPGVLQPRNSTHFYTPMFTQEFSKGKLACSQIIYCAREVLSEPQTAKLIAGTIPVTCAVTSILVWTLGINVHFVTWFLL